MKLLRLFGISLILIFIANSCLEYQFTTKIYPDGSCDRILSIRGDSSDLMHGIIPVPHDSMWKIHISHVPGDQKKFELTATGHFASVEALNNYFYKSADSMPTVSLRAELKKKFRWFYTYLDYKETYLAFTPYTNIPISKYLNDTEVKILFASDDKLIYQPNEDILRLRKDSLEKVVLTKADSLKLEKKKEDIEKRYNDWVLASVYNYVYEIVANRADKIKTKDLNKAIVMAVKDSIYANLMKDNKVKLNNEGGMDVLLEYIFDEGSKHFPIEKLRNFESSDSIALEAIGNKESKMQSITSNTYANKLFMPGMIMSTNAKSMNGNELSWEIEPGEFFFYNYEMTAESRIMNKWAFWVSGIVVLVLLAGFVIGAVGKKKQ